MYLSPKINLLLLVSAIAQVFAIGISFNPARAQSITPANDGTGTQVTTNGNQIDINGGTQAGTNLFHSFEKFGLNQNEIANFLSGSDIQNILGRITGGNPSVINGLIQVTGGNPNLFLVNPSGIFFGPNATLNVPADFTATTATNIGIGDNFFNAFGENNYSVLTGSPNGFVFSNLQPGSIVNSGNLTVSSGSNLNLLGGTVASTGELSGGNITVATVPGENLIKITPKGHLLSLEIPASVTSSNPSVASLPELLTGSGTSVNTGDVVANKVTAQNATLSAEKNLTLVESQLQTTGDLNLLAKDTVFVRDSVANPFVAKAGGNLFVQGNQSIDILALNHPQTPFQSGGNLSLVSDGVVSGDAHFASGGQFKISTLSGEPGNFVSLFDPIILSKGDVELGDYTGASLHILAGGSVKAGDVEITGTGTEKTTINPKNTDLFNPNNSDSSFASLANVTLSDGSSIEIDGSNTPTLDIRAGVDWDALGGLPQNNTIGSVSPNSISDSATDASITVGDVTIKSSTEDKGTVFLTNQFKPNPKLNSGEIKTGLIDSGSLAIDSRSSISTSAFPFTVTGEATIQSTGQKTTLSLSSPTLTSEDRTKSTSASEDRITLTGNFNVSEFKAEEEYNVAFVIDVSGSTVENSDGTPAIFGSNIGDLNNDGLFNTVLDAEIAAFIALNKSILASEAKNNTTVGVIPFATDAKTTSATPSGVNDILTSLKVDEDGSNGLGTGTNYNNALIETNKFFEGKDTQNTKNLVFFVSDGLPSGETNTEISSKVDNITAFGILDSQASQDEDIRNSRLATLKKVDENANENSLLDNPLELTAALTGSDIDSQQIKYEVQISVNGEEFKTIPQEKLTENKNFISFNEPISGLKPGDNEVKVQVVLTDQNQNETQVNATQNVEVITAQTFQKNAPELPTPESTSNPEKQVPQLLTPNQQLFTNPISPLEVNTLVEEIEKASTEQFIELAGDNNVPIKTVKDTKGLLSDIAQKTGVKPAAVYTRFLPEKYVPGSSLVRQDEDSDLLNIIIVTAEGKTIRKQIEGATREKVIDVANKFTGEISSARKANSTRYLKRAKQLYDWLIKPYEAEVQQLGIKNLMFVMDPGLRHLPVAALNDGKQFVIEKYSVGLLPSLSLSDTRYAGVQNSKVLAMGTSTFTEDQKQDPLPAVPVELSTIAGKLWEGKYVSGENFTLDNLKKERANTPYGIIHLATHAEFPGGSEGRKQSFIQLYNQKLRLENVRELGWNNPPVELLVLSACNTALGDLEAELGFAGLAVQTGVKSAVASLWFISDAGTLGVMSEFYRQLSKAPIKAEALRQTQLAMLQGKVRVEGNQLIGTSSNVTLTPEQAEYLRNNIVGKLSHPYYWASFTMIGSPW